MTESDVDPAMLTDPAAHAGGMVHPVWSWMRRHAPVFRHEAGAYPAFWSVTRYADVRRVYEDHRTFSSAAGVMLRPVALGDDPGRGLTLALTDPPRHGAIRALIADLFGGRAARAFEDRIRRATRALLDTAQADGGCDFAHDVTARLTIVVIGTLLGVPEADHDTIFQWSAQSFAAGRSLATHRDFMCYLIELMEESRAEPGDDIVSRLVTGSVDGQHLSDVEVLLNCENIVGAAENSGLSMAGGVLAFAHHPEQWRLLDSQREHLSGAVNEVLRWTSSATHSMRTVTAAVSLGGQRLEPGDRVVVWLPSANRDEAAFVASDTFQVTRRPNRHLSFGAGPHACIGAALARVQSAVLLAELLDRGVWVEPLGAGGPVRSIVVNGPAHLPVRLTAGRPG